MSVYLFVQSSKNYRQKPSTEKGEMSDIDKSS